MRPWPALIVAAALAAGGCGERREDVTRTTPTPVGPAPQIDRRTVAASSVSLSEYAIRNDGPPLRRPGVITFVVTNDGTVPHALAVDGPAGRKQTPALVPGQRATLTLHLPAGQYRWYCPLADHEQRGMVGRVSVAEVRQ